MIQIGSDRERIQSWFMSTLTMKITTITQKWSHKNIYQGNHARQEPGASKDQLLQDAQLTQPLH